MSRSSRSKGRSFAWCPGITIPSRGLSGYDEVVTPFEVQYLGLEPFLLPLHRLVRRRLLEMAGTRDRRPLLVDVGGRKSHYTIGVPADVTLTDLPRETEIQEGLNLGINQSVVQQIYSRRSNIRSVLVDDMTRSRLPDETFDIVVSVEVLEHVDDDGLFIQNVHRVMKPGGNFLMTTPNGDFVANDRNPDHRRHYTREQLRELLGLYFSSVDVEYAIADGRFRDWGLQSWSARHPFHTLRAMAGNLLNDRQSKKPGLKNQAFGTHHLIATVNKGISEFSRTDSRLRQG